MEIHLHQLNSHLIRNQQFSQSYQSSKTAEALNQPSIFKEHEKVDMHIYHSFLTNCKFEKIRTLYQRENRVAKADINSIVIKDLDKSHNNLLMRNTII